MKQKSVQVAWSGWPRGMAAETPEGGGAGSVSYIQNGFVTELGTIRARPGTIALNATEIPGAGASPKLCWGVSPAVSDGTGTINSTHQLAAFGTTMYVSEDGCETWAAVSGATGLTAAYWDFAPMTAGGVPYILATNGNGVYSYRTDTGAWAAVGAAPTGVRYIEAHGSRLWGALDTSDTVVASSIDDFAVWSGGTSLELRVNTNDGEPITGIRSVGSALLVFKENGTAYIDGYGDADVVVGAGSRGISQTVGCVSYRTIVSWGDRGAIWQSKRGIESFTAGGGLQPLVPENSALREWLGLTFNSLTATHAVFDAADEAFYLFVNPTGTSGCWQCIRVDLRTRATSVYRFFDGTDKQIRASAIDEDGHVILVAYNLGFMFTFGTGRTQDYLLSDASTTYAEDIELQVRPHGTDFGHPCVEKWVRAIRVDGVVSAGSAPPAIHRSRVPVSVLLTGAGFVTGTGYITQTVTGDTSETIRSSYRTERLSVTVSGTLSDLTQAALPLEIRAIRVLADILDNDFT